LVSSGLGDTIYVWQTLDHRDGEWGIISMMNPQLGISSPLVARSLEHVNEYRGSVELHRLMYGDPVRLARFTLDGVEEAIE
jgi:hypothetical protein